MDSMVRGLQMACCSLLRQQGMCPCLLHMACLGGCMDSMIYDTSVHHDCFKDQP